jgi:hypothetical protein
MARCFLEEEKGQSSFMSSLTDQDTHLHLNELYLRGTNVNVYFMLLIAAVLFGLATWLMLRFALPDCGTVVDVSAPRTALTSTTVTAAPEPVATVPVTTTVIS